MIEEGDKIFMTSFTTIQIFTKFEIIAKGNPTVFPLLSLKKKCWPFPVIRVKYFESNGMFSDLYFTTGALVCAHHPSAYLEANRQKYPRIQSRVREIGRLEVRLGFCLLVLYWPYLGLHSCFLGPWGQILLAAE